MDATRLLEQQHREAEALFEKLSDPKKSAQHRAIAQELGAKLLAHMIIEQNTFYPATREAAEEDIHEGYEEHHIARGQIHRILHTDADDETFAAKVKALKELIEHHVKEEEKELFPKVRRALDEERLKELGRAMKRDFDALVERRPRTLFARAEAVDVLADIDG